MGTPRPQGDASLALSRACWRSRSSNKADTVGTTRGESSEGAGGEKHASAVTGPKRSSSVPSGHSIFASGLEGAATTVRPELTVFRRVALRCATSPRPIYALIDGAGGRGSWSLTMHLAGAAHARPAPPLLCTAYQSAQRDAFEGEKPFLDMYNNRRRGRCRFGSADTRRRNYAGAAQPAGCSGEHRNADAGDRGQASW